MENVEENKLKQAEEMEVLEAIYGEELEWNGQEHDPVSGFNIRLVHNPELYMRVRFPTSYPLKDAPIFSFSGVFPEGLTRARCEEILLTHFGEHKGTAVVYDWVEIIKNLLNETSTNTTASTLHSHALDDQHEEDSETLDGKLDQNTVPSQTIVHGEPLTDRKSVFQAHLAEVHTLGEVDAVMKSLLSERKIARATHNIMAYRFYDRVKDVLVKDCDDDGEAAAGGRLAHVMEIMGVENVIVVVSRWYGGIHLGPDRFKHMNNCARQLLEHAGYVKTSKSRGVKSKQKSRNG